VIIGLPADQVIIGLVQADQVIIGLVIFALVILGLLIFGLRSPLFGSAIPCSGSNASGSARYR
jgi:hypothetical protein